jgi:hypothetical protein
MPLFDIKPTPDQIYHNGDTVYDVPNHCGLAAYYARGCIMATILDWGSGDDLVTTDTLRSRGLILTLDGRHQIYVYKSVGHYRLDISKSEQSFPATFKDVRVNGRKKAIKTPE